jgi:DNA-binding response OmpR family regulator
MNASILIVEDEGLIALDLRRRLEKSGFTVVMINDNGAEALQSVERLRPDLVLMDIRLRGDRDGIETADLIRRNFHIPVMFVTASADRETIFRARIAGPFDYIVKPFHNVDFRDRVETAIHEHRRTERQRLAIEQQRIRAEVVRP